MGMGRERKLNTLSSIEIFSDLVYISFVPLGLVWQEKYILFLLQIKYDFIILDLLSKFCY